MSDEISKKAEELLNRIDTLPWTTNEDEDWVFIPKIVWKEWMYNEVENLRKAIPKSSIILCDCKCHQTYKFHRTCCDRAGIRAAA